MAFQRGQTIRSLIVLAVLTVIGITGHMVKTLEPRGITGNPDHIAIISAATRAISLMLIDQRPDLFYWGLT